MFFSLYMYTNNTNSLIIVGAHLTKTNQKEKKNKQTNKKTKGIMYNSFL